MLPVFNRICKQILLKTRFAGTLRLALAAEVVFYIMFSKISIFLESAVRVTIAFLMSERLPT